MPRRIFISFQSKDRQQAKGFNLMRYSQNTPVEFVGRHLLDPVKSNDPRYIAQCISEQMKGTSATVVLLGENTSKSKWVRKEIEDSVKKGNGVLGIRLKGHKYAPIPKALTDCGAEIINWEPPQFPLAIERAIRQSSTISQMATAQDKASLCIR